MKNYDHPTINLGVVTTSSGTQSPARPWVLRARQSMKKAPKSNQWEKVASLCEHLFSPEVCTSISSWPTTFSSPARPFPTDNPSSPPTAHVSLPRRYPPFLAKLAVEVILLGREKGIQTNCTWVLFVMAQLLVGTAAEDSFCDKTGEKIVIKNGVFASFVRSN